MKKLEENVFLLLVGLSTLAFLWLLWPFSGSILWGTVLAILFAPLYRYLCVRMGLRPALAAVTTILLIVIIVMLPLAALAAALGRQASALYDQLQSGQLDVGVYFKQVSDLLPVWMRDLLGRLGLADLASVQKVFTKALQQGSQFLTGKVLNIGQTTVQFFISLGVMLYLLFFLLRDGEKLYRRLRDAIPLPRHQQDALFEKFAAVVRATVKGDILVSMLQGALEGFVFWFLDIRAALLWGVLMAVLSLLPAVGAALVWLPVALYLLTTGAVLKGVALIAFGAFVIGLIDNLVRPVLVGSDTRMPDYIVLLSTLGGLQLFGLNGFVMGPAIAATFITVWTYVVQPVAMTEEALPDRVFQTGRQGLRGIRQRSLSVHGKLKLPTEARATLHTCRVCLSR